jgi:high-affinity iron transporter
MIIIPIRAFTGFFMSLARIFAIVALVATGTAAAAEPSEQRELLNVLHILDYIGVDYAGAVDNGAIKSPAEYQEQREFAAEVTRNLHAIGAKPDLERQASTLEQQIADRAPADAIRQSTRGLTQALLLAYHVDVAPTRMPSLATGAKLFAENCASCHGPTGAGDGPAASGLKPPPANFHDRERQRQRSLFAIYNTLGTGVTGTAMPAFAQLTAEQRWALAFHVGNLPYSDADRAAGETAWKQGGEVGGALGSLEALARQEPSAIADRFGARGEQTLAYLRAHPEVLADQREPLAIASSKLKQSIDAYAAGRADAASQLAVSAYLDGFELAEAQLATIDEPLMKQIEQSMMDFRGLLKSGAGADQVRAAGKAIEDQLAQARERLLGGAQTTAGSFAGSFVILAREGLEAILVLAAMFAFLRKTDRRDALPYLHGGWIVALLLGAATWAASNWVVGISGAGRELTEGFTALLAAAILLSVGLWLHSKSYSNRWQQYVAGKMQTALGNQRPWGIAFLAFIAVYREVFETVLFYRALWGQGDHVAIVLGLIAAAIALLALTWAVFAVSMRLPIREFFGWSSALIVVLAVVFTGKGVAALQEAGAIAARSVHFVRIPLLGIYPNAQGLALQAAVLLLVLGGIAWNHFRARAEPAAH